MKRNLPIAVIDTSVLIALHQLNMLRELSVLYHRVHVPTAVRKEFVRNNESKHLESAFTELISGDFFSPCDSYDTAEVAILISDGLGPGESEAISQAKHYNADVILIDEKRGRTLAKRERRNIKGTIRLLADFQRLGIIDCRAAVSILKASIKFRSTEKIINQAMQEALSDFVNTSK